MPTPGPSPTSSATGTSPPSPSDRARSRTSTVCDILGVDNPAADTRDSSYAFEAATTKAAGGDGWADVWKRGHFAWEYKGKHKDLDAAYTQLLRYREDLENPPLLVVCDIDRFEVHTNFTGTAAQVHSFTLDDLGRPTRPSRLCATSCAPSSPTPSALRPEPHAPRRSPRRPPTQFAELADGAARPRRRAARAPPTSSMQLLFCLFAEDVGLLPERPLHARSLDGTRQRPRELRAACSAELFARHGRAAATSAPSEILRFNGGLFADADVARRSRADEIDAPRRAPPARLGAGRAGDLRHALRAQPRPRQARADRRPLHQPRRHRYARRAGADGAAAPRVGGRCRPRREVLAGRSADAARRRRAAPRRQGRARGRSSRIPRPRSPAVTVLDPACGSRQLPLRRPAAAAGPGEGGASPSPPRTACCGCFPRVDPRQLHGIEINPYAHELAQVTVWIGYLQWMRDNGFGVARATRSSSRSTTIELHGRHPRPRRDPEQPVEPDWPDGGLHRRQPAVPGRQADARRAWATSTSTHLFSAVRRPGAGARPTSCCYWFEKARAHDRSREGASAPACWRRRASAAARTARCWSGSRRRGDIFFAESDRDWMLDGATVHVSMVGFDDGAEDERTLDGRPVPAINADLTARRRPDDGAQSDSRTWASASWATRKAARSTSTAKSLQAMLAAPRTRTAEPNCDVVRPWVNGRDITRPVPRECGSSTFGLGRRWRGGALRGAVRVRREACQADA